jgi:hypothetical protein
MNRVSANRTGVRVTVLRTHIVVAEFPGESQKAELPRDQALDFLTGSGTRFLDSSDG